LTKRYAGLTKQTGYIFLSRELHELYYVMTLAKISDISGLRNLRITDAFTPPGGAGGGTSIVSVAQSDADDPDELFPLGEPEEGK